MENRSSSRTTLRSLLLLAGILLIALCLRGPITGVAPIMALIKVQFNMDALQLSMLTTLPLIAFAVISPFASRLGLTIGIEKTLFLALNLMILGSFIRIVTSLYFVFLGTALIGIGIALANVLLPSLLKRNFNEHITSVTSAYVLMMGVGATVCASSTVPLAHFAERVDLPILGWAFSLVCLAIFPFIALMIWIPQLKSDSHCPAVQATHAHQYLWRSSSAWGVTLFLGLNLTLMYIFIAWFPAMLSECGYSQQDAGIIYGLFQLSTIIPALIISPLMRRVSNKKRLAIGFTSIAVMGILGVLFLPHLSILWSGLIGFGTGGGLIIAMSLLSIKAVNSEQATTLSGMAQCIGYSIAALGPILTGALHSVTGNWKEPLLCCGLVGVIWCYLAYITVDDQVIAVEKNNKPCAKKVKQ